MERQERVAEEFVAFAEELADVAGDVIRRYWRLPIEVIDKHEPERAIAESPVTVADRETEAAMRARIEARYPAHGIYGEEHGVVRADAEYVWVLDPIDGTKGFVRGAQFAVALALLDGGAPVLGVLGCPTLPPDGAPGGDGGSGVGGGALFWAERGHGAFTVDLRLGEEEGGVAGDF
jgi:fructose-1,6-bisphosphatase/inositol monophosphatase family enzyme